MRPLAGTRVLAVEQYGAGPFGSQYLADLGAEVVKIEPPQGGDYARALGPWFVPGAEREQSDASLYFQSLNVNKRSFTLDLKHPRGREILGRLAATADAVTNNSRGDVPGKLGITYQDLAPHNERIVCCHCTGYGREGERRAWPGYDFLMQAEAGYFTLIGDASEQPSRFGLSVVDYLAGAHLAIAVLAGIQGARATGKGRDYDVTLWSTALYNLNYMAAWGLNGGTPPIQLGRSSHPSLTPCQLYRTGDGWIYLMCNKEKFWPALCRKIERPELIDDERFVNFAMRLKNRGLVQDKLEEALSARTSAEWLEVLAGDVPVAPVRKLPEVLESSGEHTRSFTTEDGGSFRLMKSPIDFQDDEQDLPCPKLGADTDRLLAEIGYDEQEVAQLREDGAV